MAALSEDFPVVDFPGDRPDSLHERPSSMHCNPLIVDELANQIALTFRMGGN